METTSRPFTPKERADLARLASPRAQLSAELLSLAVAFLFLFAFGAVGARVVFGPPQGITLAWIAAVAAPVAVGLILHGRRSVGPILARERVKYTADLASGQATCTTYEITDALRVDEFEDEGSHYYLKLAGGGVLFLSGQWLYEYEVGEDDDGKPTPARFPCRRFTVERAAKSGLFLDMKPLAAPFEPSGTLPPFEDGDHRAGTVPSDGDVLGVDFESLRRRRAG
jgi:hypothetical protein